MGELSDESCMAIAITESLISCVTVAENEFFALPKGQSCDQGLLQAIVNNLISFCITANVDENGGSILVFEPSLDIAAILQSSTMTAKHQFCFASSSKGTLPSDWISVHPRSTRRTLRAVLPENVAFAVDLTDPAQDMNINLNILFGCPVLRLENSITKSRSMQKLDS